MSKSRYVDFRPDWAGGDPSALKQLEDTPSLGFIPPSPPRLPTRILPVNNGNRVSAQTLYDVLHYTQRLMNYSAYEAVNGPDPERTPDLRSLDERLLQLARLEIEPFDSGSFVIPAELGEGHHRFFVRNQEKEFTSRDVLKRFSDVMNGVAVLGVEFQTCLGVLETIENLGKVINREARGIEYAPSGFSAQATEPQPVLVNADYIGQVAKVKLARKSRKSEAGTLAGVLTLVDVLDHKLKVRLFQPDGKVVSGRFLPLTQSRIVGLLGKAVTLYGTVTTQLGEPTSIQVIGVDPLGQ